MRYTLGNFDYVALSKSSLVVITGNDETVVFSKTVVDLFRQYNAVSGNLWVCESLVEFEQKARQPAFFGRWWYSGSADKLSASDKQAYTRLLKKPVLHGLAVLTGLDFSKYKYVTKGLKNSPNCHEIATSFPGRKFLVSYVQREVSLRGADISIGASEAFIWRLSDSFSKYEYYIDKLVLDLPSGVTEVKIDNIKTSLKEVNGSSFDDFLKYLLKPLSNGELKRTLKLFKSYSCMLEDGALVTLRKVRMKSQQYLELRRLINEGYLPVGVDISVERFKKLAAIVDESLDEVVDKSVHKTQSKKTKGKFEMTDILQWSDLKLKREIEIASIVPIADWYNIVLLSSKQCYTETEAEFVLFDILTRTRNTKLSIRNNA